MWRHLKEALNDFRHALKSGDSAITAPPREPSGGENADGTPATAQTPVVTLPEALDDAHADRDAPTGTGPPVGRSRIGSR